MICGNGADEVTQEFRAADLHRVRARVRRAAADSGLAANDSDDLVLAVNELAANAVEHAGGGGAVTVRPAPEGVAVQVADHGPGLPPDLPTGLPSADQPRGRGLWLVRKLCRHLRISSSSRGVTVRVFMPAAASR